MRLIDGNAIAQQVLAEVKERVAKLAPVVPHVAFVRVGDDPAAVRIMGRAGGGVGRRSESHDRPG